MKNRFERGFSIYMRGDPVLLPLSFPRFFTKGKLTEKGLLKEEDSMTKG